jgi:hypothetical protein
MRNRTDIENWGWQIVNEGLAVNDGRIYNPDGWYTLDNFGALDNAGVIENEGVALGRCGSAWYGSGSFTGHPIEYEPCAPASAVGVLVNVVQALHPAGVLSKNDALRLSSLLQKAGKRLVEGAAAEAVALLREFDADVDRLLSNGLVDVIGRSLIARADRALALIGHPQ